MKFKKNKDDIPLLGLSEGRDELMLTIAFVGVVMYDRSDAEDLANLLDRAADMVRRYA